MNQPLEDQVRQIAADVLDLPLETVSRATSPQTVAGWDSIQQLNFVVALEKAMNLRLAPKDIDQIRSVGAAVDIIERKKAKKNQ